MLNGEYRAHAVPSRQAEALVAFNRHVAADARIKRVLLPLRDGLLLVCWSDGDAATRSAAAVHVNL